MCSPPSVLAVGTTMQQCDGSLTILSELHERCTYLQAFILYGNIWRPYQKANVALQWTLDRNTWVLLIYSANIRFYFTIPLQGTLPHIYIYISGTPMKYEVFFSTILQKRYMINSIFCFMCFLSYGSTSCQTL